MVKTCVYITVLFDINLFYILYNVNYYLCVVYIRIQVTDGANARYLGANGTEGRNKLPSARG